jgi:putative ABC transport system permease protein
MRPRDLLGVAVSALRTRGLRATLSALGVAIGVASLVSVLGLSASSRADLLAKLDRLGTNLLQVAAGQRLLGGDSVLPEEAEEMAGRIGPVTAVSSVTWLDEAVYRNELIPESDTGGIGTAAVDVSLLETLQGRMAAGRFLDEGSSRFPTVVLGAKAAEQLGINSVGGRVTVVIGGHRFLVVGILEPLDLAPEGDRAVMIGRPVAEDLFDAEPNASAIYVRAHPEDIDDVTGVLAATVNPERPEEVEVARPSDVLEARAAARGAFTALLLGLGVVALFVGGVGIANIMVISVLERRPEIGLRRALGATRGYVAIQFLTESVLLSGLGGFAGVILGAAVTIVYAGSRGWRADLPPEAIVGGALASFAIGAVAGLYPAARAARLSPAEALRTT